MKFSIITPTYKRKELLERAVNSVIAQTYKNWEMIIVNDSPLDTNYDTFTINDPRIRYFINEHNMGVNFSRNFALEKLGADSTHIIFLDDDDYLAPDALTYFSDLILMYGDQKWFMTNRALKDGTPTTQTPGKEGLYNYARDYLLLKRIKGDATHCINTHLIVEHHIRFLTTVKQAEEWFFFYQVGSYSSIMYSDHNSTISDGYDTISGLNFRKRGKRNEFSVLLKIIREGYLKKVGSFFLFYIFLRMLKIIFYR